MSISVDDLMGFNPQDMSAFNDKGSAGDPNVYKTNPLKTSSDDGNYHSVVRLIVNPLSPADSIVSRAHYFLEAQDGNRLVVSSLSVGDKSCPLFRAWKRGHFSGEESYKAFADSIFNKNESRWVLVQVIEDENQPELKGRFMYMKLAKDIFEKVEQAIKVDGYPVMDYVIGSALNMNVKPGPDDPAQPQRKQREISYSLCNFGDFQPIIKTDGTNLFTDDEIELIDEYVTAAKDIKTGKTQKKKDEAAAKLEQVKPQIRPLYEKAIAYVRENLVKVDGTPLDLVKDQGYTPWSDETIDYVNKWIEMVDDRVDPKTITYSAWKKSKEDAKKDQTSTDTTKTSESAPAPAPAPAADSDLPF